MIYESKERAEEVAADLNKRRGELLVEAHLSPDGWTVRIVKPQSWHPSFAKGVVTK